MKLVLKGIWAIPVIASILILGSLGLIQEADAATRTFTTDTIITSNETIASGETWTINLGVVLIIAPGVTITVDSGGTITNLGFIDNRGTIDNDGTINNIFDGISTISGILISRGTGIINNNSGGIINNDGRIVIDLGGTINYNFGSTIDNSGGTIENFLFSGGTFTIGGDFITGGIISPVSCGTGTTLDEATNECEADVTEAQLDTIQGLLDAALAELVTLQGLLDDALEDLENALAQIADLEAIIPWPDDNQGQGKGEPGPPADKGKP